MMGIFDLLYRLDDLEHGKKHSQSGQYEGHKTSVDHPRCANSGD